MVATGSSKLQLGTEESVYKFKSKPSSIRLSTNHEEHFLRSKNDNNSCYGNIMFDRRVVRGNTFAQTKLPLNNTHELREMRKRQEVKRRNEVKQRVLERLMQKSPLPVKGRMHSGTQTEKVMDCMENFVIETDIEVQTEQYLDRPSTPMFVHFSIGDNKHTQIYSNDIFDFDIEVISIIKIIISKIMEQSMIEIFEEEELANLRQKQREFEQARNSEIVEERRLKEQEARRQQEKKQRLKQKQKVLVKERECVEKIAAREFSKDLTGQLLPAALTNLNQKGYFYDPVNRSIENSFMNELLYDAVLLLDRKDEVRRIVDCIIQEVISRRRSTYKKCRNLENVNSRSYFQTHISDKKELDHLLSQSLNDEKNIAVQDETSANDSHNTNISFDLVHLETTEEKNDLFNSSKLDSNPLHSTENYPTQDEYPTTEENQAIYDNRNNKE